MRELKSRTQGLVLLTATPMQVHPVELWDLLNLLGLSAEWTESAFLEYFDDLGQGNPSAETLDRMAGLFQALERDHGEIASKMASDLAKRVTDLSWRKANKVLRALRDDATTPRRQLETPERRAALAIMRAHTPVRHLISRHTRELLRRYFQAGTLSAQIAERRVEDRFIDLTSTERELYESIENYIATTYNQAAEAERTAAGFVMTTYRRRIASSFQALRETLERRSEASASGAQGQLRSLDEDVPDDETADEILDAEEVADLERQALVAEEQADIERLLGRIRSCPPDSKLATLTETLAMLRAEGYKQVMVFTQYVDTMDFLRDQLLKSGHVRLMCFSGRGGELPTTAGHWRKVGRDEIKSRFRDGEADILLCTDAAAEGLNFQFCGALVNYDMPWNPMRVEQRIGRIDRLGQEHRHIRIVNLHYEGTVEADVYRVLRNRIGLFKKVVGRLQPILARLPQTIADAVLSGAESENAKRSNVAEMVEREAGQAEAGGFDIDAMLCGDLAMPERPPSPVTMEDLDRVIAYPDLMPPGTDIQLMGRREYGILAPRMAERMRVTTDPVYYEENADSVELWSPGNSLFQPPEFLTPTDASTSAETLKDILLQRSGS